MAWNTLFAAPFDLSTVAVTGAAQPVLDDVNGLFSSTSLGDFSFSQTGTFVYISGQGEPLRSIFWLDSAGHTRPLHSAPGFYNGLQFSPDGERLVFGMGDVVLRQQDIWVQDLQRGPAVRLTSPPGVRHSPLWSPDGQYILFVSGVQPNAAMYRIRADGSGDPQRLLTDAVGEAKGFGFLSSLSLDGKWLAFEGGNPFTAMDVWTALIGGDPDHPRLGKAEPFLRAPGFPQPAFSPDGRWLAYSSRETGTAEIYVRLLPGPGGRFPISTGGGQFPLWSRNGRELFFLDSDRRIMVTDYTANSDAFVAGTPRVWSEQRILLNNTGGPFQPYGLAPDGKRFAVMLYPDGTAETKRSVQLTFLLNFFDELRRRVPTK